MKWTEDLLLEKADRQRGQYQLAMYAVHLSTGSSSYLQSLKPGTIKEYVRAASTLLLHFTGHDLRKDHDHDSSMGTILAPVYKALDQYDTIPDRREPYTLEMHRELLKQVAPFRTKAPEGPMCALTDWFAMGLCAGFRLSEWGQPSANADPRNPQKKRLGRRATTQALLPGDIRIKTESHRRATGLDILQYPLGSIRKMWIRFRWQKNGHHGEERLFTRNPSSNGHCFVASMYSVLTRFQDLTALESLPVDTTPLGLYLDAATGRVRLITSPIIESLMRSLASVVYGFHPIDDATPLQQWGSHSLRVGACVALHARGFSNIDIKWLLRWRSDAFMAYLQNIALLADRHNRELDRLAMMPHLI